MNDCGVAFRSNCEVAIHVPDLAAAEAFYVGVLGFRLVSKNEDLMEIDSGALRLFVNRDAHNLRTYIPSLDVEKYGEAKRFLEEAGCTTVPAFTDSDAVYFQDP